MMGVKIVTKSRMLITDQVAIAPCTDPTQVAIPTFEAKPLSGELASVVPGYIRRKQEKNDRTWALHKKCRIIDFSAPPLRSLRLCGELLLNWLIAETQRTQRWRREKQCHRLLCKASNMWTFPHPLRK